VKISILLLVPATLVAANLPNRIQVPVYDVILRHGTIVDGTGRAQYRADVGVTGGSIARIGDLQNDHAVMDLDVNGLVVAPGFINLDSRASAVDLRQARNMLEQGVTTEIGSPTSPGQEPNFPFDVERQPTALPVGRWR
jgi:predicted amidohydrolase